MSADLLFPAVFVEAPPEDWREVVRRRVRAWRVRKAARS